MSTMSNATAGSLPRVRGVFRDTQALSAAVNALSEHSVPADSIRVLLEDPKWHAKREVAVEGESGALRGAKIGAGIGALVGALIVLLAFAGLWGEPGAELLSMTTLSGAIRAIGFAALSGVPLGALIGMGHWSGKRSLPEGRIGDGRAIVEVHSAELEEMAARVLRTNGAEDVTVVRPGRRP